MLSQRLRYGGPEATDEERIAIAHRLEEYAAMEADDRVDPRDDEFRKNMRSMLRDSLRRFCIAWPPAGESEPAPPSSAPRHSTGPRTPARKDRSSQNARTHGLSSLTSAFVQVAHDRLHFVSQSLLRMPPHWCRLEAVVTVLQPKTL